MTPTQRRWTRLSLWLGAMLVLPFGMVKLRCTCGQDIVAWLLLAASGVCALAALALLIRDIRIETAEGSRPWWRAPSFQSVMFEGCALVLPIPLLVLVALAAAQFGHGRSGFEQVSADGISFLILVAAVVDILATDTVLRRGGELVHGGRKLLAFDAWCQRNLGAWWIGRFATASFVALLGIGWGKPFASYFPLSMVLYSAYISTANALNLDWPGKERMRKAFATQQAIEASPDYQRLRSRNLWIDCRAAPLCFLAFCVPLGLGYFFNIYDIRDAHMLWLLGLAIGLMGSAPGLFILSATLPQGRARLAEYLAYCETQCGKEMTKALPYLFGIFLTLTLVCTLGVALTANFRS
jgi:hypothetical protein